MHAIGWLLLRSFPQRNIAELGPFARSDKTNPPLVICETRMFRLQDMVINSSAEVTSLYFNHKLVPGVGIDWDVDLGQDFAPGFLGNAGHLLNPD